VARLQQVSGTNNFVTGQAANYSSLPTASEHNSEVWLVINGEGIYLVNRKSAGLYISDGSTWRRLGNIPAYFDSANFEIYDTSDNTKTMDVDVSNITTGTNRTLTMTDYDQSLLTPLVDTLTFSDGQILPNIWEKTKEPSGFIDPKDVVVTGDPTNRTVTLTGTVEAYWRGAVIPALVSGWESAAHANTTTNVYYLSYDGTSFAWTSTTWTFDKVQIAYAFYDPTAATWVYLRETHGMMGYESHQETHDNIGTYKQSGADLASYVLDSTTAANRRPTLPVLNDGSYTHAELVGAGAVATFDISNADIVELSTNNPYYNEFTGGAWQETLMPANSVMSIWLYAIPVAADATSQKYRFLFGQGQWITQAKNSSGNQIARAQAAEELRTIGEMNLGTLEEISPEFVAVSRITITYTGGNWYINDVSALTGSKFSQGQSPSGNYLSSVTTDTTLTGAGTVSDPLSAEPYVTSTAITYALIFG